MAVSTTTIVVIAGLTLALGIAIWWLAIAYKYHNSISGFSYTRGANLDPGVGNTSGIVNMTCDSDHEICVWRATQICSGESTTNHELSTNPSQCTGSGPLNCMDPFGGGQSGTGSIYGDFNPLSTTDLTQTLGKLANGSSSYTYNFNANNQYTCPINGTRPQLIATYTCIPKGSKCTFYNPKA